ncbi:hypothetical protein ACFOOP_12780 [Marinicaulis aureus]|uniref:Uncharacterized protein n=1 Tax=Hyphococcus aureus TaxID=2666033 RepID=A0ABW1KYU8_9PROT
MTAPNVGSKAHPSQFDCYDDLAEDEPYFVIRAGDSLPGALIVLHSWFAAAPCRAHVISDPPGIARDKRKQLLHRKLTPLAHAAPFQAHSHLHRRAV